MICLSYNLTSTNSYITTAMLLGSVLTYLVVLSFCPSSFTSFLALVTEFLGVWTSTERHRLPFGIRIGVYSGVGIHVGWEVCTQRWKKMNIMLLASDLNFQITVYLNHSMKYFLTYVEMGWEKQSNALDNDTKPMV